MLVDECLRIEDSKRRGAGKPIDGTYGKLQIDERTFGIGEHEIQGDWVVIAVLYR